MIIIGGGSTGLFLAIKRAEYNLAKNINENIFVVEEHKKLGLPIQCTGILTDDIYLLIKKKEVDKFRINKVCETEIYSKNESVKLKLKDNIIIDNLKFIEFLEAKAKKLSVNILRGHKYISNNGNEIKIKKTNTDEILTFYDNELIGADGPLSKVASNNNLCTNRKHLLGVQARVKIDEHKKNIIDFYPSATGYSWCVPEGKNIYRVGLAISLEKQKQKNELFQGLLKKYPGKQLELQAGLIPLYAPRQKIVSIKKGFSVALVGDAALQIKNTTGGGIIPGMKAAEALSRGVKYYRRNIKKLNRELYLHYLIHKALTKYSNKDFDRLVKKTKSSSVKKVLEKKNRDNVRKIILSLAKDPKMINEGLIVLAKSIR